MSLWMKSQIVTIQMKATEQYFPVVLFITLYKVVHKVLKKVDFGEPHSNHFKTPEPVRKLESHTHRPEAPT